MNHDRGCSCGLEPYEYDECRKPECFRGKRARGEEMNTEHVNDRQVGGSHYYSQYQHWDWAIDVSLGPMEYAASKYISRWRKKHEPTKGIEDVEKAKHYIQKIIEAHSEGRYPTAISRLKDISLSLQKTRDFGKKNGLHSNESMLCLVLVNWETPASLIGSLKLLDRIITNFRKAARARGEKKVG
jgi:hypothetical protein